MLNRMSGFLSARRVLAVVALAALAGSVSAAGAQWVWKNEKGRKVFSDMPPPSSVPQSRIIKSPVRNGADMMQRHQKRKNQVTGLVDAKELRGAQGAEGTDAEGVDENASAEGGEPMSDLDKRVAEKEKKAKDEELKKEEAARKKEMAERKARQKENCSRIAEAKRSLTAGTRLTVTDENGERRFLNESDINKRLDRLKKAERQNKC